MKSAKTLFPLSLFGDSNIRQEILVSPYNILTRFQNMLALYKNGEYKSMPKDVFKYLDSKQYDFINDLYYAIYTLKYSGETKTNEGKLKEYLTRIQPILLREFDEYINNARQPKDVSSESYADNSDAIKLDGSNTFYDLENCLYRFISDCKSFIGDSIDLLVFSRKMNCNAAIVEDVIKNTSPDCVYIDSYKIIYNAISDILAVLEFISIWFAHLLTRNAIVDSVEKVVIFRIQLIRIKQIEMV